MRIRRFPANTASDCLRFAKFQQQFSESCGATDTRICEMFSALQSTFCLVTDFENNVQIDS